MFEQPLSLTVEDLLALAAGLGRLDRSVGDGARVDRIRALEVVKAAAAAAQARDAADLDASQRAVQAAAGVPAAELGRGVAAQVALARRDSPHRGSRHLGLAKALVHEMPCTLAALSAGRISEWRATILVRETAVLTRADRETVDREVAGDADTLERLGDRALAAAAKQAAYRLDAMSVVARNRRAEGERRVSTRPAPDTMAYLTALLPVGQAVAVWAGLGRAADTARCDGDPRGRGQLMADTLVTAITANGSITSTGASNSGGSGGSSISAQGVDDHARPTRPGPEDVAVRLVMTDRALLDGDSEPALVDGYGPVPAAWARELIAAAAEDGARVFLKRLLTDRTGALVAMESRARLAPAGLSALIRTRDGGTCRTPWCDAPVRHIDHVVPHAAGGPTSADTLQGLCEACNHTKQAPGWRAAVAQEDVETATVDPAAAHPRDDGPAPPGESGRHTVITTTPTGHTYRSTAPPLPGGTPEPVATPVADQASPIETWLEHQLALVS